MKKQMKSKIVALVLTMTLVISTLSGCALLDSKINELNGSITGNTYNVAFY